MICCYGMAGSSDFSQLGAGSTVPADFKGILVTTTKRKWGRPVPRYVYATSLTLRDKPSVSGKKLGELKFNQLIPDAQFAGVSADKKYAWGYSAKLGGYFMWMAGEPQLNIDADTGKVKGKWKVYLTSRGLVRGPALSAAASTPLSATTASQATPTVPPSTPSALDEREVEIEKAGIGPAATFTLTAVIFAAGAFLLSRMR